LAAPSPPHVPVRGLEVACETRRIAERPPHAVAQRGPYSGQSIEIACQSSLAGNEPEEIGGGIVVSVAGENLPAGAFRLGKSSLKKLASGKFDVG